jgi:hypothetical protein
VPPEKCWEIKKCAAEVAGSTASSCPVYKSGLACWECDWKELYRHLPSGTEKENAKKNTIARCMACPVRAARTAEVDRFLEIVKGL